MNKVVYPSGCFNLEPYSVRLRPGGGGETNALTPLSADIAEDRSAVALVRVYRFVNGIQQTEEERVIPGRVQLSRLTGYKYEICARVYGVPIHLPFQL